VTAPVLTPEQTSETDTSEVPDRPWVAIVWNDPVNLMSYVRRVLQKLFGYSYEQAHALMMQVHEEGKAVVSSGRREQMEADVQALHGYGLWATVQKDD
jgi:ATP-dependent Clp protease adaptor protein ClpS